MVEIFVLCVVAIFALAIHAIIEKKYKKLECEVLKQLGFSNWNIVPYFDTSVIVKSRQTLEKYNDIRFFQEHKNKLAEAKYVIQWKAKVEKTLKNFLEQNEYKNRSSYGRIENKINAVLQNTGSYRICVDYISSAGRHLGQKEIYVDQSVIRKFEHDPTLLMSKSEHNKYLKEQQKDALNKKHREYYDRVNRVIDYANENKNSLILKDSQEKLDDLITQLFDRTVNSIKKIKTTDSEEWNIIGAFIARTENEIKKIVGMNLLILSYYESPGFLKIKETCDTLMSTQREFNAYINEKVQSISKLFGTRVVRNETIINDEYNYIRPYKKTITPFTAAVSATVFASAENSPLEYVIKYFYPNKEHYPEQIQKLQLLVEELETLNEARQIIENYKKDYQQYLGDVPSFIMENDAEGFYSRLGFAYIDERVLTVEYKFIYTSNGGFAQRSFTVSMTEENIIALIKMLESKLTASAFAKEQRTLMTKKLREFIKSRDHYTCCICGNSTHAEPNLLLEIDHIIPIAKGGPMIESNLQTLCWKCNRSKHDKILL